MGQRTYDYAVDMWAVGAILAENLFQRFPFFKGQSEPDQLLMISRVTGSKNILDVAKKYKLKLDPDFIESLGERKKVDLHKFVNKYN
jgi:casein kinase II subunit alpha